MYSLFIVDDDFWMRKYVKENFDWESYNIRVAGEAEDGEEAYEKLDQLHVDIMLVDIAMPGINGIELSELALQKYGNIKVILISGHREFEYARRAISIGVMDYILKPVEEDKLIAIVTKAVKELDRLKLTDPKDETLTESARHSGKSLVADVLRIIETRYSESLYLDKIADEMKVHPSYLCRRFKKETGENLIQYIMEFRIKKAKQILHNNNIKVHEVASEVGYENMRTFTRIFKSLEGITPSEYIEKHTS